MDNEDSYVKEMQARLKAVVAKIDGLKANAKEDYQEGIADLEKQKRAIDNQLELLGMGLNENLDDLKDKIGTMLKDLESNAESLWAKINPWQ